MRIQPKSLKSLAILDHLLQLEIVSLAVSEHLGCSVHVLSDVTGFGRMRLDVGPNAVTEAKLGTRKNEVFVTFLVRCVRDLCCCGPLWQCISARFVFRLLPQTTASPKPCRSASHWPALPDVEAPQRLDAEEADSPEGVADRRDSSGRCRVQTGRRLDGVARPLQTGTLSKKV